VYNWLNIGSEINDAIIFMKLTSDFLDKKKLYTTENLDSYLYASELKYLFKEKKNYK
jgi:hypothetical protein